MIELFTGEATTPGPAITAFVSWEDIALALGIDEQWELLSPEKIPSWVRKAAFNEAEQYVSPHTSAEKRLELEGKIIDSIVKHWSANKIIPGNIDFDKLFGNINTWSWQTPINKEIFGKVPAPGTGLEWVEDESGLHLTMFPPFEIPYVESYYQLYRSLPELNLDELSGFEIVETCYFVEEALGSSIEIDLSDWDNYRPRIYDLVTDESI